MPLLRYDRLAGAHPECVPSTPIFEETIGP